MRALAVTSSRWFSHHTSRRHHVAAVLARLRRHLALGPGDVAHVVELPVLGFDLAQDAVVAHPVGGALHQPGAALGAEVVGTGQAEQVLGELVVPVHALRRLGHALLVGDHQLRVALVEVRGDLVADQVDAEERLEGDLGGRRQRSLEDRLQLVADLHAVPRAHRPCAPLPRTTSTARGSRRASRWRARSGRTCRSSWWCGARCGSRCPGGRRSSRPSGSSTPPRRSGRRCGRRRSCCPRRALPSGTTSSAPGRRA